MSNGIVLRKGPGWFYSRFTIEGTRIKPRTVWDAWKHSGWTREQCMAAWRLTAEQVDAAIAFSERRSAAARRSRVSA